MALLSRKLGQAGGANLQNFLGDIAKFVAAQSGHATLGPAVKKLGAAQEAVAGTAMRLLMWFQSGQLALVPLSANRFCEMMSELVVAWVLLEGAVVADTAKANVKADHPDHAFYTGKVAAALYYARNVLPGVEHKAQLLAEEDKSPLDIPDAAFATV